MTFSPWGSSGAQAPSVLWLLHLQHVTHTHTTLLQVKPGEGRERKALWGRTQLFARVPLAGIKPHGHFRVTGGREMSTRARGSGFVEPEKRCGDDCLVSSSPEGPGCPRAGLAHGKKQAAPRRGRDVAPSVTGSLCLCSRCASACGPDRPGQLEGQGRLLSPGPSRVAGTRPPWGRGDRPVDAAWVSPGRVATRVFP